jgi:hypothetical protein
VVERTKDKVVLEGELRVLGRSLRGTAHVHLFPPDRWEARFYHRDGAPAHVYAYRLTPTPRGCRLDVEYRMHARRLRNRVRLTLAKPLLRREIDTMWDGFLAHMERDLRA